MVARKGFSLIELVFAIVIIALTVVSLPTMNDATSKGEETNLVQEAIFAASAQLNQVATYRWDENSQEENVSTSKVVWVSSSDCNETTKLRPGHIFQQYHRRCLNDKDLRPTDESDFANNASNETDENSSDPNDDDDLDDTIQDTATMYEGDATTATGYKTDYDSEINVSYAGFTGEVGDDSTKEEDSSTHNIKKIVIKVKNKDGELITTLSTYSSNIGEVDYIKREF